jgi:TPR repeat protein
MLRERLRRWVFANAYSSLDWEWERVDDWQHEEVNNWEPSVDEAEKEKIDKAIALEDGDIKGAIEAYQALAEQGSAWAMRKIAWHYETGSRVSVDLTLAESWYRRAILAGSWLATLNFARLEALRGAFDDSEYWLEDGVEQGWVPASFWLAWYLKANSTRRRLDPRLRQLLEHAEAHGHPMAREILATWMGQGRFGFRLIPQGLRALVSEVFKTAEAWEEYKLQSKEPEA